MGRGKIQNNSIFEFSEVCKNKIEKLNLITGFLDLFAFANDSRLIIVCHGIRKQKILRKTAFVRHEAKSGDRGYVAYAKINCILHSGQTHLGTNRESSPFFSSPFSLSRVSRSFHRLLSLAAWPKARKQRKRLSFNGDIELRAGTLSGCSNRSFCPNRPPFLMHFFFARYFICCIAKTRFHFLDKQNTTNSVDGVMRFFLFAVYKLSRG